MEPVGRYLGTETLSEPALFLQCCLALPPLGRTLAEGTGTCAGSPPPFSLRKLPASAPAFYSDYFAMIEVPGKKINLSLDGNSSSTFPPSNMMADVLGLDVQIGKFHFHRINSASHFKNYCLNYANIERTNKP